MDNTQARRDNMEDNAEHELRDLQRLKVDYSAQLLNKNMNLYCLGKDLLNKLFKKFPPAAF